MIELRGRLERASRTGRLRWLLLVLLVVLLLVAGMQTADDAQCAAGVATCTVGLVLLLLVLRPPVGFRLHRIAIGTVFAPRPPPAVAPLAARSTVSLPLLR